jgi:CheY-like chemotaxis protein
MYGQALAARGAPVVYASDGREALVQIYRVWPRAVVADVMLPFIDAGQLCGLIRSDPATAAVRVVVVTSDATSTARILDRGADVVLVKPAPLDALVAGALAEPDAGRRDQDRPASTRATGERRRSQRIAKVRAHERFVTRQPPLPPPPLKCPMCDANLQYDRSHIGGVNERQPEQWDSYVCASHGVFQYRHRTRKLRRVS